MCPLPSEISYIFYFIKRIAMRKNVHMYICVSQHINIVFLIMSEIKSKFAPPLLIKIYFFLARIYEAAKVTNRVI